MADRPLKPGEKRVYAARVRKEVGEPWTRVKTTANPSGQWGTRAQAQAEVDKLEKRGYAGHTFSVIVKKLVDPADRPLKPGEKRVYGARVRKSTAEPFKRVKTRDNGKGQWGTRAQAQEVLDRLERQGYNGHTFSMIVKKVAGQPKVNDWLTGNIVDIMDVPREDRDAYRDTLYRAARAAKASGEKIHVNSSYRFFHEQAALFAQNMIAPGIPKPGRPLTAVPGKSPHERGIGLDIPNAREKPKLIAALRAEKLIDDVASEKWHVTNHAMLAKGY